MRFTSIRARVALLSTLFSLLLVGSITTATYFLVARGMSGGAEETASRLAFASERVVVRAVQTAASDAEARGLEGVEAEAYASRTLLGAAPESITRGLVYEGSLSLFVWDRPDSDERLAWSAGDCSDGDSELRTQAAESGSVVKAIADAPPMLSGMFARADIGDRLAYVPVSIPGVHAAVLQVCYSPDREEGILDTTRAPMVVVTIVSLVAALLITMATTGWTLSVVNNLRRTAESIDIGQLDVRLPDEGGNEVAELARSLNHLIENLRRRNEAQARFIADASHELATPVAGIRGYVNILRAWGGEDLALREEAVSAIDRESRRMARLCSDLLSVIRNEEVAEYRQIRYDMNAVCREVLANAATRYIDQNLEFTGPVEGPLWLYGDPDRIEEALGILTDNACKYTPPGGQVSVTTRRHRDRVLVDVTDTGIGIPAEDIPNVFDRFYRSDASRSKETGGFGLGLAIAKNIVDASGGTIAVQSVIGQGTTFEVSLPRQRARVS